MNKITYFYKVVRIINNRFYSSVINHPDFRKEYIINQITLPTDDTLLFGKNTIFGLYSMLRDIVQNKSWGVDGGAVLLCRGYEPPRFRDYYFYGNMHDPIRSWKRFIEQVNNSVASPRKAAHNDIFVSWAEPLTVLYSTFTYFMNMTEVEYNIVTNEIEYYAERSIK